MFFNELDLLEIRLNTLKDVVDEFVIVEATETHSKKPRALEFLKHQDRFKEFPIDYRVVYLYNTSAMARENEHRQAVKYSIKPKDTDVVMFSDLDEIPDPDYVPKEAPSQAFRFNPKLYYFYLNLYARQRWERGTIVMSGADAKNYDFMSLRYATWMQKCDAGWHFSSLGGRDMVLEKLSSYSHTEFDNEESKHIILGYLASGKDIHGQPLEVVPIDDSYSKYIQENLEKYLELVWLPSTL